MTQNCGGWHRNRKTGAHRSASLTGWVFSVFIERPCLKTTFQWKGFKKQNMRVVGARLGGMGGDVNMIKTHHTEFSRNE